jgi:hypothetical protein
MVEEAILMIVVGLDVRKQSVTAVAIDEAGRRLGEKVVLVGCDQLLSVAGQSGVRIKLHGPGGERNARALVAPPGPPRAYGGRKLGRYWPFRPCELERASLREVRGGTLAILDLVDV